MRLSRRVEFQTRFECGHVFHIFDDALNDSIVDRKHDRRADHIVGTFDHRDFRASVARIRHARCRICIGDRDGKRWKLECAAEVGHEQIVAVIAIFSLEHNDPATFKKLRRELILNQQRERKISERFTNST